MRLNYCLADELRLDENYTKLSATSKAYLDKVVDFMPDLIASSIHKALNRPSDVIKVVKYSPYAFTKFIATDDCDKLKHNLGEILFHDGSYLGYCLLPDTKFHWTLSCPSEIEYEFVVYLSALFKDAIFTVVKNRMSLPKQ